MSVCLRYVMVDSVAAVVVVECRIGEIYYEECSFPHTHNACLSIQLPSVLL